MGDSLTVVRWCELTEAIQKTVSQNGISVELISHDLKGSNCFSFSGYTTTECPRGQQEEYWLVLLRKALLFKTQVMAWVTHSSISKANTDLLPRLRQVFYEFSFGKEPHSMEGKSSQIPSLWRLLKLHWKLGVGEAVWWWWWSPGTISSFFCREGNEDLVVTFLKLPN